MTEIRPQPARRIRLKESEPGNHIRMLSDAVSVDAGKPQSWVTITRTGTYHHPKYGQFEISRNTLSEMVRNYQANTYGQDIAIDVAHMPENGSAGFVKDLRIENGKLRALVEWTPFGVDAIEDRGYRYLSADYTENYVDNEHQAAHGPLLFGAGLVTRPHIKHLDRVTLAEFDTDDSRPTIITDQMVRKIETEERAMKFAQLLRKLKEQLAALKLGETVVGEFYQLAESMLTGIEEEARAKLILDTIQHSAVQLAEKHPNATAVTLQLSEPNGMSEADVKRLLTEHDNTQTEAARQLSEKLANKQKLATDAVNAAEGLDDETTQTLGRELSELITVEMSDDSIRKLAEREIAHANREAASRKLGEMGFSVSTPRGRLQFGQVPASDAAAVQAFHHEQLRSTSAFHSGGIRLSEDKDLPHFVRDVLNVFDANNAPRLSNTARQLAEGGLTNMADTDLPVGFQREVIREALSDLNLLQLVATYTDPNATATTQIPYELRDNRTLPRNGMVFERQPIPKVGMTQKMDLAYINGMKLAIDVSNEVMHFSRASGIDWDAYARNVENASRTIRELLCARIANEMQRASDAYLAKSVADETITLAAGVYKTAEFPIVRQHQVYDLEGNAVGDAQNPITVKDGSTELPAWDGSGDQPAALYYSVVNYNLGYLVLVDETGAPATAQGTVKISYDYATNIQRVDADVPNGSSYEKHLNKLIQAVGARKAAMSAERFIRTDFMLMSEVLNDTATNAEQFTASGKRNGADTSQGGDLTAIKSTPAYGTNAPGIDLGDERILMGQRNTTAYTIAKPWMMSEPQQARDEKGRLTGALESYGEEYNTVHTPKPVNGRYTSVLFYSASNR